MRALEQGLGSLRLAIQRWLSRVGWRRERHEVASECLAREFALPAGDIRHILDHAVADLQALSDEDGDPWPIINRARLEIDALAVRSDPFEEAAIVSHLRQLPERDRQILRCFNDGRKHNETARLLGTDVDSVCHSLVNTYAGLRLKLLETQEKRAPRGGPPKGSSTGDQNCTRTPALK